jgi:3-oxoadipate enol-lactonase
MPFIQIRHTIHYYTVEGKAGAAPLVFSNSLGSDLRIWDPVMPYLRDRFHIIRYDSRGHGLSDAPPPPYQLSDLVEDLAALLDGLRIKAAIICGLSVGGMIAQGLAAAYPRRVRSLILCSTATRIGTPAIWDDRIAVVEKEGVGALTDQIMARWFTPGFRDRRGAEFRGYANMLERTPPEGYIGTCCAIREADLRQAAASIYQPSLVICGEQDPATPPLSGQELAEAIAGAKLALIRDAAHIPCVEQPELFSRLLIDFVEESSLAR